MQHRQFVTVHHNRVSLTIKQGYVFRGTPGAAESFSSPRSPEEKVAGSATENYELLKTYHKCFNKILPSSRFVDLLGSGGGLAPFDDGGTS